MRFALAAFALAVLPAIASAGTLTFDDGTYSDRLPTDAWHTNKPYDTYSEDGFSFKTDADDWFDRHCKSNVLCWENDGKDKWVTKHKTERYWDAKKCKWRTRSVKVTEYAEGNGHQVVTQTFNEGDDFNLCQFDAKGCDKLLLTGSNGSTFVADIGCKWQTFVTGDLFKGVTWVTWEVFGHCWSPCSGEVCIDNVVNCVPTPEPVTLALLGVGAAGMLAMRRRQAA